MLFLCVQNLCHEFVVNGIIMYTIWFSKDLSGTVQSLWEQENIGRVEVFVDETEIQHLESKVDTLGSLDETETKQLESNVDIYR